MSVRDKEDEALVLEMQITASYPTCTINRHSFDTDPSNRSTTRRKSTAPVYFARALQSETLLPLLSDRHFPFKESI